MQPALDEEFEDDREFARLLSDSDPVISDVLRKPQLIDQIRGDRRLAPPGVKISCFDLADVGDANREV